MNRINIFFRPKSIAVIGASRRPGAIGHTFLASLTTMGFTGDIYPVNPNADAIEHLPCYHHIADLPGNVDVAAVLLPYQFVPAALEELAQKSIKNIIVVSAGFREIGGDGVQREQQLLEIVQKHQLNIIGPNCMGLFNSDPRFRLNASFSPNPPLPGGVAFISQSGALGVGAVDMSRRHQMGFSSFISLGNKADIDEVDALEFMGDDDASRVVILYLESIARPHDFRRVCRHVAQKKPVLIVKSGRGHIARRAASSHTGALATPDVIVDSFLKQSAAIRCKNMEEMLDTALTMSIMAPRPVNRIAIISNGGGPAILTADALEDADCTLPNLSDDAQNELKKILPPEAACSNPIDMLAAADHHTYQQAFDIVSRQADIDAIVVVFVQPPVPTDPAHIIEALAPSIRNSDKAVLALLMIDRDANSGVPIYRSLGVPVYSFPNEIAHSIANIQKYLNIKKRLQDSPPLDVIAIPPQPVPTENTQQLPLQQIFDLLEQYHLSLTPYLITHDPDSAVQFAQKQSVALKIANESIIHKSDAGLVHLNITQSDQLRTAFHEIAQKSAPFLPPGQKPLILVQQMIIGFPELALGLKRDLLFGPVVMIGIGGVLVEALQDVSFRIAPLDDADARDMLNELHLHKLLDGVRHHPPADKNKIIHLITTLAQIALDHPEILELDLNPIIWNPKKNLPIVADARITTTTNY